MSDYDYNPDNPWEQRLADAFADMGVDFLRYYAVCFQCGNYFKTQKGRFPTFCSVCRFHFNAPHQFTVPDFILPCIHKNAKAIIVYVDGAPHRKTHQKRKDLIQRANLLSLGYMVTVIWNDLIDNCEVTWLRIIASGIGYMTRNPVYYAKASQGEKELIGMGEQIGH
jgi:hypothetical protein